MVINPELTNAINEQIRREYVELVSKTPLAPSLPRRKQPGLRALRHSFASQCKLREATPHDGALSAIMRCRYDEKVFLR